MSPYGFRGRTALSTTLVLAAGALATLRVLRTSGGVEEDVPLAVGFRDGEKPPVSAVADLAAELTTRHGLCTLRAHLREARVDLTVPPCFERPPVPFGFDLGLAEVAEAGTRVAAHPPLPAVPVRLGAAGVRAPRCVPGFAKRAARPGTVGRWKTGKTGSSVITDHHLS